MRKILPALSCIAHAANLVLVANVLSKVPCEAEAGAVVLATTTAMLDPRDMHSGIQVGSWRYCDQSYCVASTESDKRMNWLCTITVNDLAVEGQSGERVVSVRSTDSGSSWSAPITLEPNRSMVNAYSSVVATSFGRVYAIYNAHVDGPSRAAAGGRVDTVGSGFWMKYTDDFGSNWSTERYLVPYRTTAVDRSNAFPGHPGISNGTTKIMWTTDQAKIRAGKVFIGFTKIGVYPQGPPEEGFILESANILTERDPAKVSWNLLPGGDHGLSPIGEACAFPSTTKQCVAEEFHVAPLFESPGFFAVFRTVTGYLGATQTADPSGSAGWAPSYHAKYLNVSAERSAGLKNPRGPVTLKRFENGKFLLLFYNNAECVSNHCPGRKPNYDKLPNYRDNRVPLWIAAGVETAGGTIEFSQPEIAMYNTSSILGNGTCEPGYADFMEEEEDDGVSTNAGRVSIITTQKTLTLCMRIEPQLLSMLWNQGSLRKVAGDRMILEFGRKGSASILPLPKGAIPSLSAPWQPSAGMTVELWLREYDTPAVLPNQTLLSVGSAPRGLSLRVPAAGPLAGVALHLSDGIQSVEMTTDKTCARALADASAAHHVALVIDAGPLIVLFIVDGILCDGGSDEWRGWHWLPRGLGDIAGDAQSAVIDRGGARPIEGGRVYGRALRTSEVIGNFRAGLPISERTTPGRRTVKSDDTSATALDPPSATLRPSRRSAVSVAAHASNITGLSFSVFDGKGRLLVAANPRALAFYVENRWQRLGDGLVLQSQFNVTGTTPILGAYAGHESRWLAGSTEVHCLIHAHARALTFTQMFPNGANGTNVTTQSCVGGSEGDAGCMSEPMGYFPAINPHAGLLPNLTYFGLSGNMNEYHQRGIGLVEPFGGMPGTGGYKPNGPTDSGPFILFEEPNEQELSLSDDLDDADDPTGLHMMISPMDNFMMFSQALGANLHGLNQTNTDDGEPETETTVRGGCAVNAQQDADFSGNDILVGGKLHPLPANSSSECCEICSRTKGCSGWVWISSREPQKQYQNLCYPKSSVGRGKHRVGHITGCVAGHPCPSPGTQPHGHGELTYAAGIHFEVQALPPGFNSSTMLYFGARGEGVTATVLGWGQTLRAVHGTSGGKAPQLANDLTTSKLGAWTDAGTFYYRPARGSNMQVQLKNWIATLKNATPAIPVHYLQLDDWFYETYESDIRCMTNFTPAKQGGKNERGYFEGDLGEVADAVGLPLHLYHACFDETTPYSKTNGGQFDFDVSPGDRDGPGARYAQVTADDSFEFYSALWEGAKAASGGRFVGSEVDHQVDTIHYINKHRQHIDYAQRYYSGMSKAAVESGISLQFCMSVPHHILASITLDGVTHARGSFDNHGSVEQNMAPLAYSSLFFDAVGLRPSKDNVQTLRNTRGGLHLNPQLEAVIATLSTGPVGLGDGAAAPGGVIGPNAGTNATVILASCDSHGQLLQPSRPAAGIDAMFGRAWNPPLHPGAPTRADWPARGVVTQTHTSLEPSNLTVSWIVLSIEGNQSYRMPVGQLYPPPASQNVGAGSRAGGGGGGGHGFLVHEYGARTCVNGTAAVASGCLSRWDPAASALTIPHTGGPAADGKGISYPWSLLTIYEAADAGEWRVLGELSKYVALSAQRFTRIGPGSEFCVRGSGKGEVVRVSALDPAGRLRVRDVLIASATQEHCSSFE